MKSLVTLIKLQKTKVDEQRVLLANLQKQLTDIQAQIDALMEQQAQQTAMLRQEPALALNYDLYLKGAIKRLEEFEKRKRTVELAVNLARDKLAELFEEQKRYELAEKARLEEEEAEEQRRETHILDEVGSVSFVRKKKKK
ncbi:MAG: hypothetical protein WC612_03010 [Bdellovibrionales bacterium]|jgi:flagellar biosynthesis chaperone FliJ